jgi:hypothetical protein
MATRSNSEFSNQTQNRISRVVAFFSDRNDAYRALSRLKEAGFSNDRIGLAVGSGQKATQEYDSSFWQKVKDFFTGEDHHEDTRVSTTCPPLWAGRMTATGITSEALPQVVRSSR